VAIDPARGHVEKLEEEPELETDAIAAAEQDADGNPIRMARARTA
jgi:hypothetical protein